MAPCTLTLKPDSHPLGRTLLIAGPSLEAEVTLDVGPRVIRLACPGGPNIFEDKAPVTETLDDGRIWRIYGGHRVWHSPEAFPRSYMPDNSPVEGFEKLENGVITRQAEEPWTHIQKVMEVRVLEDRVRVVNTLVNRGAWPVELAVWSLTIGAAGGMEVVPVVQRNTGLLPNRSVVMWPDSTMDDPRVRWGRLYVALDIDGRVKDPFKFGCPNDLGWAAFFNHGHCLVMKYTHQRGARYPDFGCSWETYTQDWGVEMESLSPLTRLAPGRSLSHVDEWFLFPGVARPANTDAAITASLTPVAPRAGITLPAAGFTGWRDAEPEG
jgi:hypothetical protein